MKIQTANGIIVSNDTIKLENKIYYKIWFSKVSGYLCVVNRDTECYIIECSKSGKFIKGTTDLEFEMNKVVTKDHDFATSFLCEVLDFDLIKFKKKQDSIFLNEFTQNETESYGLMWSNKRIICFKTKQEIIDYYSLSCSL